jgi:AraC-like DNA-binding protein
MRSELDEAIPGVLASAATGIGDHIARHGGDLVAICGRCGIDPETAGQPTVSLDLSAYCALFEEAARQTGQGNFGLWFGNRFKPRDLGLIGYAAVSSPTLGSALENFVQLFAHHQQSTLMRIVDAGDGLARLEYQIRVPDILARRQDAELSLGMFLNIMRENLGTSWAPLEVHFEHPRPEAWREHEQAFDAPVYFAQPTNALVFRRDLFARPMPAPDLKLLSIARMCLETVGVHGVARQSLADRVRSEIRTRLASGYPALEDVANALRLTPGAIQRDFNRHNMSYKDVVEEVRKGLAFVYLRQRELPLSEIAFLLGYSELSAFSRAFSRWVGTSPRHYRENALKYRCANATVSLV